MGLRPPRKTSGRFLPRLELRLYYYDSIKDELSDADKGRFVTIQMPTAGHGRYTTICWKGS